MYHSFTIGQISKIEFDKQYVNTSQNCKKDHEKYIFTDLNNFGK